MSFRMARAGRLIEIVGGLTVTLPTAPPICPAGPRSEPATFYPRANYGGPGAPPLVIYHYAPREVSVAPDDPTVYSVWSGTLRNRRTMTLTLRNARIPPGSCGWPRHLHWTVRRLSRVSVSTGGWTGALTAPGMTGTVAVQVGARGHVVDAFSERATCADGTGGGGSVDANRAAEYIDRKGRFQGPIAGAPGVGWRGRFGGDTLTGTVAVNDRCAGLTGAAVQATFLAHRTAPRGVRCAGWGGCESSPPLESPWPSGPQALR